MATVNRRSKIINAMNHPAVFPGYSVIADIVTMSKNSSFTVTFPAKSLISISALPLTGSNLAYLTTTAALTNGEATIVFALSNAAEAPSTETVSYRIEYSITNERTSNAPVNGTIEIPTL